MPWAWTRAARACRWIATPTAAAWSSGSATPTGAPDRGDHAAPTVSTRCFHGCRAKVPLSPDVPAALPTSETPMLATTCRRPRRMRIEHVAEPEIEHPNDAIVRVTRSCICGSDIHIYNGLVPDTRVGTIIGHEFTGVVEQVGPSVQHLKVGDRVLVPFNIFCGSCYFCQKELYGNCHNVNSQASAMGGFYGYTHTAGGYDGGQAEL